MARKQEEEVGEPAGQEVNGKIDNKAQTHANTRKLHTNSPWTPGRGFCIILVFVKMLISRKGHRIDEKG